jgi:hypothetical protein
MNDRSFWIWLSELKVEGNESSVMAVFIGNTKKHFCRALRPVLVLSIAITALGVSIALGGVTMSGTRPRTLHCPTRHLSGPYSIERGI